MREAFGEKQPFSFPHAAKLRAVAQSGVFNTFMGEFNFADLPEADLMRSIRLFGERVVPALRDYEPF